MNAINRHEQQAISRAVLEIDVNNHAGVMSHVVGLFSRRAYNVEGILCLPVNDGRQSRIWLLVNEDTRLAQMIKQVEKLEEDYQKARATNKRMPPGWHAHLGYLYFHLGKLDQAKQEFVTEKAEFPESAIFIDRFLAKFKTP